jgi:16S rRNA C1402 (ribose-2'-O) methylase RsmI
VTDRGVRGEIVVVIEGAAGGEGSGDEDAALRLAISFVTEGARKREAARRAATTTGVPATRIYEALIKAEGDRA